MADNLTLLRRRIGDNPKTNTEVFEIDNGVINLTLSYTNSYITSIFDLDKSSTALVDEADYTFDNITGTITLLYNPNPSKLTVNYIYYAFTDDELNDLISQYGLNGATVEAIRWIIADASRLHDYSQGQTSESLNQIVKNLRDMIKDYQELGNPDNPNTKMMKRTNDYYRGTTNVLYDLSRDDSLSI